eukprot:scaffold21401_cov116-Isochrysis_galbana.AAC.6
MLLAFSSIGGNRPLTSILRNTWREPSMVLEQEPRTRRAGKLSDAGQGFTGPAMLWRIGASMVRGQL